MELESMALEMPVVDGHPNRRAFRGVLTTVDRASDRAPSGARGHKVKLTRKAVEAAIPSLLGMALDYAPELDRHDARRKVGVITEAQVAASGDGRQVLEVAGYLYAKDFPEIVDEIARRGVAELGMSYEIADVRVADIEVPVWAVMECTFTGAAVLRRDKAAYSETWVKLE
jgi:hypothetical protein